MSLIYMSKMYNKTPAELLYIEEEYASYCLNEACSYIRQRIENKEEPIFEKQKKKYKTFADMYKKYE